MNFQIKIVQKIQHFMPIRGGADKSLTRPTSRCRRTESIVSERGVCSCAELQVLSCYRGWNEACQEMCAISTTWRHELSSSFFFLQSKEPKEIHAILTETLGEHAPSYTTVNPCTIINNFPRQSTENRLYLYWTQLCVMKRSVVDAVQ